MVVLFSLERQKSVPLLYLVAEPAATMNLPWYTGALSTLTGMLWFVAGGISLFASRLTTSERGALATLGVFSIWLGLDDVLMLHEAVFPTLLGHDPDGLGTQPLVYASYIVMTLGWLAIYRRLLRHRETIVLGVALALFAVSVGLDVASESNLLPKWSALTRRPGLFDLVEDGFKLLGLSTWTLYLGLLSKRAIETRFQTAASSDSE
jgi:hypothetical protein